MENIKIYTVEEVAKILGVYKQNVYKDANEGKLYPVRRIGKRIIIPQIALKGYIYNLGKEEIDKLIKEDIKKEEYKNE